MLDVGLIGPGHDWESRYRPALLNLRHRMRVRAVHAAVGTLAEQIAAEWRCDVACGMLSMMRRSDVQALLILDTAWYGPVPAEFACKTGKPAFLAGRLSDWVPRTGALIPMAAENETPLMPDFGHRYTPATSRLKELIATRLGRPDAIVVHAHGMAARNGLAADADREAWLAALDWACHLVGTAPVEVCAGQPSAGEQDASVAFARSAAGGAPATARIVLDHAPGDWSMEIRCRKGIARLNGGAELEWEDAAERRRESLSGERGGVEVMLDHFSRRAVGGLIPVPTLDDLSRAARLAESAENSRALGRAIALDWT